MRFSALKVFLLLALFFAIGAIVSESTSESACTLLSGANTLSVKISDLAPGSLHEFCYRDRAGNRVRFLLARDSYGHVEAAFDACQQCYKFYKGYAYSHGNVICRLCGNRFPVKDLGVGTASCVPVHLASSASNGKVNIKVADVKAGKWLF
jgi:uncharacterized membrane protein